MTFKDKISLGIPTELPAPREYPSGINRAPKRKDVLSKDEKRLAVRKCIAIFSIRMARNSGTRILKGISIIWANIYVSIQARI